MEEWTAEHLRRCYFIGIDCEQAHVHQDDVDIALVGMTVTQWGDLPMPKVELGDEVRLAAAKGWKRFLEEKHVIPSSRTYLDPSKKGVFFTDSDTRNVSGVLVRFKNASVYFLPNPFAYDQINDPRIVSYLNL